MMRRSQTWAVATMLMTLLLVSAPAYAEYELWETDGTRAGVGANLQVFTGYIDLPEIDGAEDLPPAFQLPEEAGLGGAVGRLEWYFELGDVLSLDVHNRLVWQTMTLPQEAVAGDGDDEMAGIGPGLGIGASRGADRRLSTEYDLIDGDMTRLTHDIDRLVLGIYLDWFDLYVGRQAIRWGVSDMFGVADRFAPLSPFELDTIQRRGVDAARAITHITPDWEIDVVVADRGDGEPLSLGARTEYFGVDFDAFAGVGRFWERLSAMGGLSWLAGNWKVFAEGELLWNLDDDQLDRPRATVGAQRVAMDWQIGAEYHYNGFGVAAGDDYFEAFDAPEITRGETYFMGRHYAGANGFYLFDAGWIVGGGGFVNLADPSAVIFPSVEYQLEEQFSIGAGAYVGLGEAMEFDAEAAFAGDDPLRVPSEYGATPGLYYVQMTGFF